MIYEATFVAGRLCGVIAKSLQGAFGRSGWFGGLAGGPGCDGCGNRAAAMSVAARNGFGAFCYLAFGFSGLGVSGALGNALRARFAMSFALSVAGWNEESSESW